MNNLLIFETLQVYSNGDGSPRRYYSKPIPAALAAKTMEVFLDVLEVGANVQLDIEWSKSATSDRWEEVGALIDGSGGDASVGIKSANNGATLLGAWVRLPVTIAERTSPTSMVKATLALRSVFKPF